MKRRRPSVGLHARQVEPAIGLRQFAGVVGVDRAAGVHGGVDERGQSGGRGEHRVEVDRGVVGGRAGAGDGDVLAGVPRPNGGVGQVGDGVKTLAVRSRIGQLDGVWRDTVLFERRRAGD